MQAVSRSYVLAAAALAATGAVVVAPFTLQTSAPPVRSTDVRLVDAGSLLNIPVNLFDDIVNIPNTEVDAVNILSDSQFFSGSWWVPSATNLWGTDPGDIGHYMGLIDVLVPFQAISGQDQPEIDPTAMANGTSGLAQQLGMLAAAELPVSASCDAQTCAPIVPTPVITGSTAFDRDIEFLQTADGQKPFGLFDNWLKVPLSDLTSGDYKFDSATDSGVIDPSPDAGPNAPDVFTDTFPSGFQLDGTTSPTATAAATEGTAGYMPWAGDTFKLNLLGPFQDFYNSLLATPSTDGIAGTGVEIPSLTSVGEAFQNFVAANIVAFDPFVMGSPACPATCDIPSSLTIPALVQDVENWDPNNTTIQDWLNAYPDNNATTTEAEDAVAILQTGEYNLTPTELGTYDSDLAAINPELPYLFTNAGIVTDPNYLAFADGTTSTFDPTYGGYNPNLIGSDLLTLLTNNDTNFSALANPDTLSFLADPASGSFSLGGGAAALLPLDLLNIASLGIM